MVACGKCGAYIFPSELTPYLVEAQRCREHYTGSWKGGVEEFLARKEHLEGASPERMAELRAMQEDGTLAEHCRSLLRRAVEFL